MTHPLVSVIVITYNQSKYIAECIESIISQDYSNMEIIIVDDCSNDGSQEIINHYVKKYPSQVKVKYAKENKGITQNSNLGLSLCNGYFIAFTGGDDVFMPGKISKQIDWFKEDNTRSLCGHDAIWIDKDGNYLDKKSSDFIPISSGDGPCGIIKHGPPFPSSSMMFKASNIPEYFFHPKLRIISDWKFMIDIVSDNSSYGFIDGVYLKYRKHSKSITSQVSHIHYFDQLNTVILCLFHFKGKYLICWLAFFIYGFKRKILKIF
jgi:glycosyltransferase involved in cell wall biosynthesis